MAGRPSSRCRCSPIAPPPSSPPAGAGATSMHSTSRSTVCAERRILTDSRTMNLNDLQDGAALDEKMRIAGERVGAARTLEVRNPWSGALVGTVPKASVDDIRRAFSIARAYRSTLTRYDRYRILYRTAEIIRSRTEEISDLITAECGICKKDSLYEVGRACDVFVFAGNAALQDDGQIFSCDLTPHGKK